ncbi:hypothetical protein GCM10008955_15760 [Deinococcus malanensis]|uniref:Uncharacterized protein n=1 Tax=Deinococcus malanensis TaxID=1706855 RepID=A0ABQ2ERM2_9DEIO|nr:hypothetical protein GCM10008955_15760 [Deinococcus malanensis]
MGREGPALKRSLDPQHESSAPEARTVFRGGALFSSLQELRVSVQALTAVWAEAGAGFGHRFFLHAQT